MLLSRFTVFLRKTNPSLPSVCSFLGVHLPVLTLYLASLPYHLPGWGRRGCVLAGSAFWLSFCYQNDNPAASAAHPSPVNHPLSSRGHCRRLRSVTGTGGGQKNLRKRLRCLHSAASPWLMAPLDARVAVRLGSALNCKEGSTLEQPSEMVFNFSVIKF